MGGDFGAGCKLLLGPFMILIADPLGCLGLCWWRRDSVIVAVVVRWGIGGAVVGSTYGGSACCSAPHPVQLPASDIFEPFLGGCPSKLLGGTLHV